MSISAQVIPITHYIHDGFPLSVTIFQPKEKKQIVASVVFANATGVEARFYHSFAQWLSTQGVVAYTFDYRYSGVSFPPPCDSKAILQNQDDRHKALLQCPEDVDLTNTWSRLDLASIVQLAYQSHSNVQLTIIGHSLGGHLMVLLPPSHLHGPLAKVSRMLNVCGGNAYVKNQSNPAAEMGFIEAVVKPLLQHRIFYASHLGLGYDLPFGPGREWTEWFFDPHFSFCRRDNLELVRSFQNIPLLYVGFEDDDRINKTMMETYLGMFDHSDRLKRGLWIDPVKRGWPKCGHVTAFTNSKQDDSGLTLVEHGQGYASNVSLQQATDDASLNKEKPKRQDTIWRLFLGYILDQPLDIAPTDQLKVWQPSDQRDVEAERIAAQQERKNNPRVELDMLYQKAKL